MTASPRIRERLVRWLELVLIALVTTAVASRLWISGLQAASSRPSANLYVETLSVGCLALWAILRWVGGGRSRLPRSFLLLSCAVLTWGAIGLSRAVNRDAAWRQLAEWGACLSLALVFFDLARRKGLRDLLTALLVALALTSSVLALFESRFELVWAQKAYEANPDVIDIPPELRSAYVGRLYEGAACAGFLLSNTLAGYLCLPLGALVALLFCPASRGWSRVAFCGLTVLVFSAQVATLSKAGLACGLLTMGLAAHWVRRASVRAAPVLCVLLVFFLGIAAFSLIPGAEQLPGGSSVAVRLEYWEGGARALRSRPFFGFGLQGFAQAYQSSRPERSEDTSYAHNFLVQTAVDLGIPGLLLVLGTVYLLGRRLLGPTPADGDQDAASRRQRWQIAVASLIGLAMASGVVSMIGLKWRSEKALPLAGLTAGFFLWWWLTQTWENSRASLRTGMVAGAVGVGMHSLFDLDLQAPGLVTALALQLALVMPDRNLPAPELAHGRGFRALGALASALLFGLYFLWLVPESRADRLLFELDEIAASSASATASPRDLARMLEILRTVQEIRPYAVKPRLEEAELLLLLHRMKIPGAFEASLIALREARSLAPLTSDLPAREGRLLAEAEDYEAAATAFEQAVILQPSHPVYRFEWAENLWMSGQRDSARRAYAEALRLDELSRNDYRHLTVKQRSRARRAGDD